MHRAQRPAARLAAVLVVWLAALPGAWAQEFTHGLLWRVQPPEAPASYVFGTIHSEDPRVLELPRPVREAFDGADRVTLEMVPDSEAIAAVSMGMLMTDGRDLAELLGEPLFERTATLLADYGMPEQVAHHVKPWAALMTLSMPKPETGEFLDLKLYQRALRQDKPVDGLETPAEQLAVFEGMAMEDQVALLRETVDNHSLIPKMLAEFHGAYLDRDLAELQAVNEKYMDETDAVVMQRFSERLITQRNRRMLERMQGRLAEGNVFIAVGALHLAGEQGILQGLAEQGYEVTAVY